MRIKNFYPLCYPRNLFQSNEQEKAHCVLTKITTKHALFFVLSLKKKKYLLVKAEWCILFPYISDDKRLHFS